MRGAGFLAIWSDVEQKALTDYRHWLTREHTTERVTTKGFLGVRVFRADRSELSSDVKPRQALEWRRKACHQAVGRATT